MGTENLSPQAHSFIAGIKPVIDLLNNSPEQIDLVCLRKGRHDRQIEHILTQCRKLRIRFEFLEADRFVRIYTGSSQGVVARIFTPGYHSYADLLSSVVQSPLPLLLVLDQVQDPGNAGTLIRSLYALGAAGLVIPKHNGVFLGGAAIKASAGTISSLPIAKIGNVSQAISLAKKYNFTVYGTACNNQPAHFEAQHTSLNSTIPLFSSIPSFPALLILGGEEAGMRPNVSKYCDSVLHIPMLRSFNSLNVAQAGAIILGWFLYHHVK